METNSKPQQSSLRAARNKSGKFSSWLHKHTPWIFNPWSLFYFVLLLVVTCFGWALACISGNNFSQMFGWDYSSQFVPFAFEIYDDWHTFLRTGQFPLYSYSIFLGTDNIGSNSYYGLFDPFVVVLIFFPRDWIPELFLFATFAKIIISALLMRSYLKYFGLSEGVCRLGAVVYGFSGYMNFMLGFPSTVSACVYVPLILLGIEKVLKEKKVGCLVWGLFLEGITSFFFLVCLCIWGVIYAVWRYFCTIKTRSKEDNVKAMVLGVCSFALGLILCSWTLLPSIRESSLSGRTASIGTAYLHSIISSLKSHDFLSFFGFIFEEVGDNPGRELMALISFFFPSGGYLYLPLLIADQSYTYDAWTASIFCYTPVVICFFTAVINSIWKRKWSHLFAILGCVYLLFTNFAYYFFYAFSGNGYGRWFMVLVPEIILYAMWGLDQRKKSPEWIPLISAILAFVATILAYFTIYWVLEGKSFSSVNGMTYWKTVYLLPSDSFGSFDRTWYFYLQLVYIVIEGAIMVYGHRKRWMPMVLTLSACLEIVIAGNLAANYQSFYYRSWMGGASNLETSQTIAANINDYIAANDYSSNERTYLDNTSGNKTFQNTIGLNSSGSFHSLMNFDVEDYALMNRMKYHSSTSTTYNDETYTNFSWSGYYGHKRFGVDTAIGYRYYVIENEYTYRTDWIGENVPFGAEYIEGLTPDSSKYRVFRVSNDWYFNLGHAVDSDLLYRLGKSENSAYVTNFYSGSSNAQTAYYEMVRNGEITLRGAIFEDDAVVPEGLTVNEVVPSASKSAVENNYGISTLTYGNGLDGTVYRSLSGDGLFPDASDTEKNYGLEYIFEDSFGITTSSLTTSSQILTRDRDHIVFTADLDSDYYSDKYAETSSSNCLAPDGTPYLNVDAEGCYFDLNYYVSGSVNPVTRVYVIGDEGEYDDEGNWTVTKENKVMCFERSVFENASNADSRYFQAYSGAFGLYARGGRAKYICFCYSGSGNVSFNPGSIRFGIREYSDIKATTDQLISDSLQNVTSTVNTYSFETNYEEPRVVVTTIAYDDGWSVKATKEDGTTENLQMFKLDGGLVGFYAPAGETTYEMVYETPYLKIGVCAASVGLVALCAFGTYGFVKELKRKKEPDSLL